MATLIRAAGQPVAAFANWGAWVARCWRCPAPCPPMPFGTPIVECWCCGATLEILWPSEEMRHGVERLLMMRPDPATRNWVPGETLPDLMRENGEHGIFDNLPDFGLGPGCSLSVADYRIQLDLLPALKPRTRLAVTA